MKNDIDALIKDLKAAPLDRDLHNLEVEVWERIDARNPAGHPASPAAITTDGRLFATPAKPNRSGCACGCNRPCGRIVRGAQPVIIE